MFYLGAHTKDEDGKAVDRRWNFWPFPRGGEGDRADELVFIGEGCTKVESAVAGGNSAVAEREKEWQYS